MKVAPYIGAWIEIKKVR
ncbi:Protein of unknown function [Bacillus wiedmannii]|nr:Protein of unknown function [Bacillus wiedmannii]